MKKIQTNLIYTDEGHDVAVYLLIMNGTKVDCVDEDGNSALHLATQKGFEKVVILIIQSDANLNIKNNDGDAPLNIAAREGKSRICRKRIDFDEYAIFQVLKVS